MHRTCRLMLQNYQPHSLPGQFTQSSGPTSSVSTERDRLGLHDQCLWQALARSQANRPLAWNPQSSQPQPLLSVHAALRPEMQHRFQRDSICPEKCFMGHLNAHIIS
jgi:hypothetical protein